MAGGRWLQEEIGAGDDVVLEPAERFVRKEEDGVGGELEAPAEQVIDGGAVNERQGDGNSSSLRAAASVSPRASTPGKSDASSRAIGPVPRPKKA